MRSTVLFCAALACAAAAFGKEPKTYQTGKIVEMNSVQCGTAESYGRSFPGEMSGTDSGSKKTPEPPCREYLLEAEHVIYRIRPREQKHGVLLPIGQKAQFRIRKDKLLLRIEDLDDKEHEYIVVSMSLRIDGDAADAAPKSVNHLP
jgi:hypothetical protein